jgi:FADH2 O2-dependent halogenase
MEQRCDLAIVGSALGGSLLAQIARRLGHSVVLVERDRHPKFAIGESSTPLANLLLEELASRYGLPRVLPLCKWGTWQRAYPGIACGLKRGFAFYHHRHGDAWLPQSNRGNELLVAASPNDEIADTHWYRPDLDHFLVQEAVSAGSVCLDDTELTGAEFCPSGPKLTGHCHGEPVTVTARFVVDATGPRGFLWRTLALGESALPTFPSRQALFTHFREVGPWRESGPGAGSGRPFRPDDSALHHVFPGGWMWVLRFNNGITSAGVSVTDALAAELGLAEGAPAWERLLARLPAVARQFAHAQPVHPFQFVPRMAFRSAAIAGDRWALLPHTAGFVDPLFSTGLVLTLLGVERLARMLESGGEPHSDDLAAYAAETDGDLLAASRLLAAQHATLADPESFNRLTMLYFAAVTFSETARRLGKPAAAEGLLLRKRRRFGTAAFELADEIAMGKAVDGARWEARIQELIEPINVAGLLREPKRNWYGCEADDLIGAAGKLEASPAEIRAMLRRVGFAD